MARRKKGEHGNHERWLVSYADFITLLFAFFVVMFANSQTDKAKAQAISESVREAFKEGGFPSQAKVIMGGTVDERGPGNAQLKGPGGDHAPVPDKKKEHEVVELAPSLKTLTAELKAEIEAGRIQVSMEPRGLAISFKQAALFPSGEDDISPDLHDAIGKVAVAIGKIPNPIRLEGHTDAIPIHNPRFHSNWELSAARSIALLELLTTRFGIPRERMSIGGYADTAPVDTNQTEDGRSRNRRVDMIVLNQTGVLAEPGYTPPTAKSAIAPPGAGPAGPRAAAPRFDPPPSSKPPAPAPQNRSQS